TPSTTMCWPTRRSTSARCARRRSATPAARATAGRWMRCSPNWTPRRAAPRRVRSPVPEVRLTRNAERDLRRLGPERTRIVAAPRALSPDGAYLATKALAGVKPWLPLRVGDYRLLYWQRPDNAHEIGRIVHRRDLDASVAALPAADPEG